MERESPPFRGVAVEVRFNDQADKDPMCSYTSMSTCQAAWQSLLSVRSSSSLAALVAEQVPCLLTLEDITSLPPVHALSYAATAPVVVYIACYRSVRDGCTSGRLEISVQVRGESRLHRSRITHHSSVQDMSQAHFLLVSV